MIVGKATRVRETFHFFGVSTCTGFFLFFWGFDFFVGFLGLVFFWFFGFWFFLFFWVWGCFLFFLGFVFFGCLVFLR